MESPTASILMVDVSMALVQKYSKRNESVNFPEFPTEFAVQNYTQKLYYDYYSGPMFFFEITPVEYRQLVPVTEL